MKKLAASLPFVTLELAMLQPALAVLPTAVWRRPSLATAMQEASPWTRFIPLPQFNATVVNCHLGKYHAKST